MNASFLAVSVGTPYAVIKAHEYPSVDNIPRKHEI